MDYNKIKFISGLEIHQQLDTDKLFCNCPSYLRKDNPDFEVKRKLHKVAGETGEVDVATQYEASLRKEFVYQGYKDTTCLIELDEEPPKQINQKALNIALQISLLLNCEIIPITQVMRKTVIDGSNTSGFQRSVVIAKDGFVETTQGKVGISWVYLEEDAARKIDSDKNSTTYRLDRLGIPLVEIVTAPDIKTPEQVKETAMKIGEILRACKVKRGIGTIRQDINISTKSHPRAEIKGFQDPKFFITVVEKEIERQQNSVKEKTKLENEVRGALEDGSTKFLRPLPNSSRMYPETDLPLLKISREQINHAKKTLPKLKTDIKDELKKKGLSQELITLVINSNLEEFETLLQLRPKDATLIAKMTTLWRDNQTERQLEEILELLNENKIEKSDVKDIMDKIAKGESLEKAIKIEKASHDEIEEELAKIIKEKPGLRPNAYMGIVMQKFKGKLDAKKTMEIINSTLNKN